MIQRRPFVILLILTMFTNFSQAQVGERGIKLPATKSVKDTGSVFGLAIGISNYSELPKLQYADKDAAYFYDYLKYITQNRDTTKLSLFTNGNATRDAIVEKLYEITDQVKPGDKVYVYFSGHGDVEQLIQTDNCLLLLGNSPAKNYLRKSGSYLDINLFKQFFQTWTSKNIKVVLVCDACHSGSLIGGETGRKNTLLSLQQSWNNEVKLFSCQADEFSLEGKQWGGGRGLFSFYFVLGMKGLADKDNNAEVSLLEIDNYLKDKVGASSGQSQLPVTQGDLRAVISRVTPVLLANAKKEISNNVSDNESLLALKGNNNGLIDLIRDSAGKITYKKFKQQVEAGILLEPEDVAAYSLYKLFKEKNWQSLVQNNMRIELVEALQRKFDVLLDYVYRDEYDKLGLYERIIIEKELNTALQLVPSNSLISYKLRSKLLFLQACELTADMAKNTQSFENTEKLNDGITLLNKAIAMDPMSPNLYLKLGDYQLYTNQFAKAIQSYQHYQQLLPNDEYSYNKLGLAYFAGRQYEQAISAFKTALKINPQFPQAMENLRIALSKKG